MTVQLNIGSGQIYTPTPGWLSVDMTAWPVNVMANIQALPFRSASVDHIHCSHIIEHIPFNRVFMTLLEIRRVLKPNGIMYISGPDMDRTKAINSKSWIWWTENGGAKPGWEHEWVCGVTVLRHFLIMAGFTPTWAKSIPAGWPANNHAWPVDLEARFLCRLDTYPWSESFPSIMQYQT